MDVGQSSPSAESAHHQFTSPPENRTGVEAGSGLCYNRARLTVAGDTCAEVGNLT